MIEENFKTHLECDFNIVSSWDELNIEETLIKHSSNRQRFNVKLMNYKWDLLKLEKAKENYIKGNLKENSDFLLSNKANISSLEDSDFLSRINLKLVELKWCIEFCERACKSLDSQGFDHKNWIEYKKVMSS